MLVENRAESPLPVYLRAVLYDMTLKDVEMKISKKLQPIRRPLYGLQFLSVTDEDLLEFAQAKSTDIMRDYHYAEIGPNNSSRLYI